MAHEHPDFRDPSGGDDRVVSVLRDVTVPESLGSVGLRRLFDDDAIDRLLRAVPCPATAAARMCRPSGVRSTVDLASALTRLGNDGIPRADRTRPSEASRATGRRRWPVARAMARGAADGMSVAAVLVAAAGLLWASSTASRWLSAPRSAMPENGAVGATSAPPTAAAPAVPRSELVSSDVERSVRPGKGAKGVGDDTLAFQGSGLASQPTATASVEHAGSPIDAAALERSAVRIEPEAARLRAAPLDRFLREDAGPPTAMLTPTPSTARAVPSHRGYDLAFEMAHGEPPFVDPSLAESLAVTRPPLCRRTDSFDSAVRAVVTGRHVREALRAVRVEHVLAALPADATLPGRGRDVDLAMRGFPAFRSGVASRLLEISLTVPAEEVDPSASAGGAAAHAMVVLDVSAAAAAEEAWPAVCRALRDAAGRMNPAARMTVVLFADRPVVAALRADREGIAAVCDRLERLRLRGGGDLHGSMSFVRRLIAEAPEGERPRCVIVAHVGSVERAGRDGDEDLAAWRSARARGEAPFGVVADYVVIDPARGAVGPAAARGDGSSIDGIGLDAESIRRRIVEAVSGPSSPPGPTRAIHAIEDCRLEVTFDHRQVAAYRLVGHRQQVMDFDRAAATSIDTIEVEPGRTIRVVYEVVLKSDREGDRGRQSSASPVARTAVRFRRSADPVERLVSASISASDLRLDPPSGEPAAWAVWLAVGLAGHAADSPHVESRSAQLRMLQERADGWGVSAWNDPAIRRLMLLLQSSSGRIAREQVDASEFDGSD